jgi:quercetin dioxygenase-like cupin family protein
MKKMLAAAGLAAAAAAGTASAEGITINPAGSAASVSGNPDYFSGHVVVDALLPSSLQTPSAAGLVTFAPGARTAWHSHPAGQMLIVTAGKGWVQQEGQPRGEMGPGDVVWIAAGVKHWHGATAANGMSHYAVTYIRDGKNVEWMEQVPEGEYRDGP